MPVDLAKAVSTFVDSLARTVTGSLPGVGDRPFRILTDKSERHLTVRQEPPEGFVLSVDEEPLLNMKVHFRCTWSRGGEFLSVSDSDVSVLFAGLSEPLLRYHFVRDQESHLPTAHLHVHGHRDEVVSAMLGGADKGRVRSRLHGISSGRYPRLAALHLPLGGPRFRPGVEDVLQMLRTEFEIDVLPTFPRSIENGRSVYRQLQLMTAVHDDPLTAAAELERMGYAITEPTDGPSAYPARF